MYFAEKYTHVKIDGKNRRTTSISFPISANSLHFSLVVSCGPFLTECGQFVSSGVFQKRLIQRSPGSPPLPNWIIMAAVVLMIICLLSFLFPFSLSWGGGILVFYDDFLSVHCWYRNK
jgi:H+/Cl- antiporter ClcA